MRILNNDVKLCNSVSIVCVGAGEQIRKKEVVQCPVCRTSWQLTTPSPSKLGGKSFLQVSIPVGTEGGAVGGVSGGLRLKSLSPSQQVQLSREKVVMLEKIRKVSHRSGWVCVAGNFCG